MNEDQRSLLLSSSSRFPPPQGVKLSYGTAGFRAGASILQSTVYRVGILAAIRALKTQSVIGLMITASHNKVSGNGVKVADPSGGMLSQDWEPFADTLANAPDPQQLVHLIAEFVENEKITLDGAKSVEILLARDTRPSGESLVEAAKHLFRCASLDGDADRLVYFIVPSGSSNKIELVNGDKILSLFAISIKEQLSILSKEIDVNGNNDYQCRLSIVQIAYANGASMDYLKQLGLEVTCTPTRVKYLHEEAAEYDIGIYFEANGHGTILFSEHYLRWLETRITELSDVAKGSEQHKAALRILVVSELINQAVGDALSGVLLVEAILKHMGWSIQRWNEFYQDLPSRQLKVKVMDITAIVTENAETVAVTTPGIQEAIDAEIIKYPRGRCFRRPSRTEDVIHVYAEASTQDAADSLANSVAELVDQFLGFGTS